MKYVIGLLLGLFLGCSVQISREPHIPAKVIASDSGPSRLPAEVEKQFDAYLASKLATGFLDDYIIGLIKRVVQGIFLSILISILFDFPLQSALVIALPIVLISYPVAKHCVRSYLSSSSSSRPLSTASV